MNGFANVPTEKKSRLPEKKDESTMELLHVWDGIITSVGDSIFSVELRDVGRPNDPVETNAFSFEDVSESNRGKIVEGAKFQYVEFFHYSASGQKTHRWNIEFPE